jgi:hypothetical protein
MLTFLSGEEKLTNSSRGGEISFFRQWSNGWKLREDRFTYTCHPQLMASWVGRCAGIPEVRAQFGCWNRRGNIRKLVHVRDKEMSSDRKNQLQMPRGHKQDRKSNNRK